MDGGVTIKSKLLVLSVTIFLLLLISGTGSAADIIVESGNSIQTAIDSASPGDTIIIRPGTYTENINLTKSSLTIRSESGNPDDTIIQAKNSRNALLVHTSDVTIRGLKVIGSGSSYSGIYLYNCTNCILENDKLSNNGYGIRLESSRKCTISNNIVTDNLAYGIYIGGSSSNIISGNTASNSTRGLYLGSSNYNTISGNRVTLNSELGFYECAVCNHNTVYNNYFNNTDVSVKGGSGNSYNITKTAGTNVIGGSYIGGNYWGKPDGTGFSDTAVDKDGDGISDSAYRLPGDNTHWDYLPLANPSSSPDPLPPTADFSSDVTSGNAPLDISFTDKSTGNPTAWNWDFGDGTNSQDQNPVHTYSTAGDYTTTLTVSNENGEASKSSTITVLASSETDLPAADFGTNITEGAAPLAVQFTDRSQNAVSWSWDFDNNGQSDSTVQNPVYVYETPGDYTANLTVSNANGMASKTLDIKVLEKEGLPVANFEANVTSGYAPLSVLFTDRSQDATQISWDFNEDGVVDANTSPAVYVYTSPGTYEATLIATNKNGTASKTITIDVNKEHNGGSSHSSGGGGGTGGSPEPQKNVEVKELSQVFVTSGKAIKFDFTKNATCVVYVGFDSKKTAGKTTTIAEQLKNKSMLVSNLTDGEVYKYFNVWVGNSGFTDPENIENPVLCFKVEKSWLQNESIDHNSITLNRYEDENEHDGKDGTWTQLPASLTGEDDKYLYFTAEVPGYSFFAITGTATQQIEKESTQLPAEERSVGEIQSDKNETQGAEPENDNGSGLIFVVIVIAALGVIGLGLKGMKK